MASRLRAHTPLMNAFFMVSSYLSRSSCRRWTSTLADSRASFSYVCNKALGTVFMDIHNSIYAPSACIKTYKLTCRSYLNTDILFSWYYIPTDQGDMKTRRSADNQVNIICCTSECNTRKRRFLYYTIYKLMCTLITMSMFLFPHRMNRLMHEIVILFRFLWEKIQLTLIVLYRMSQFFLMVVLAKNH